LSEVEELAEEIIFMLDGKICYQGSVPELFRSYDEVKLDRAIARMTAGKLYTQIPA
jgi:Cu-processing system ATP-binding protein